MEKLCIYFDLFIFNLHNYLSKKYVYVINPIDIRVETHRTIFVLLCEFLFFAIK